MPKNLFITIIVVLVLVVLGFAVYKTSPEMTEPKIAQNGDTVYVHYTGTLQNGTKFDSSYDHGAPISFVLGEGNVIKGWDQGILGMKVGEKKKLVIPPELGYGPQAIPDAQGKVLIPANSTLLFDVELVNVDAPATE